MYLNVHYCIEMWFATTIYQRKLRIWKVHDATSHHYIALQETIALWLQSCVPLYRITSCHCITTAATITLPKRYIAPWKRTSKLSKLKSSQRQVYCWKSGQWQVSNGKNGYWKLSCGKSGLWQVSKNHHPPSLHQSITIEKQPTPIYVATMQI